jgi:hypothetical protein
MDPRTTLRDHPEQQNAAHAVRTAVASMRPPPDRLREDEISIPPTSSDPPHDVDEQFFADGEAVHRAHVAEAKKASLRPRAHVERFDDLESRSPVVVVPPERRKKLANYVKVAVGVSAFLCLVAVVRAGVQHAFPSHAAPVALAAAALPAAPSPVQAVAVPPAPAVAAVDVPAAPAAAEEQPAPPAKSAKEEKEDSRRALEHGKRKDAIEAGERSVALDPTDAEAWLILGSAQQEAGHWKEGREAYTQCVKQAKVGPVSECRMMLR